MNCLNCTTPLELRRIGAASFRACPQCKGELIGISALRQIGLKKKAGELWQRILASSHRKISKKCGSCENGMISLEEEIHASGSSLAACKLCQLVWFGEPVPELAAARPVDYQLSPEDEARLEQESFDYVPDRAAESESVMEKFRQVHVAGVIINGVTKIVGG